LQKNVDISGLHHNNYHNFLALRIGLLSIGEGKTKFNKFVYRTINDKTLH